MNFNTAFRVLLTFNATSLLVIIFLVSADDKTNQKFKISNDDYITPKQLYDIVKAKHG